FPAEQGPQQAPLFRQEAQPRLAVGGHTQIGLAVMSVLDLQGAFSNRDGRLLLLLAGEREVEDSVQLRRLPPLKGERQPRQEALDGRRPQAVADSLDRLEGEAPGHMLLGVRAGHDVDCLWLLLQRANDFSKMRGLVAEVRANDILPSWADAQAVCRLVVRPE